MAPIVLLRSTRRSQTRRETDRATRRSSSGSAASCAGRGLRPRSRSCRSCADAVRPTTRAIPGSARVTTRHWCSAARTSRNRAYVLYTLPERRDGMTVDVTLSLTGHDGTAVPVELPGWHQRPVELRCFDASGDGSLRAAQPADTRFVLTLGPDTDLFPAGDDDPYGFGHLFLQQLRVELRLIDGGHAVSDGRDDARRRRRPAPRLDVRSRPRASREPGRRAAGRRRRRREPRQRVPPVVPGAAHRVGQGVAVHARARLRHRPQAAAPGRTGVAAARRRLPRAADVPRNRGRGARRRRRPADSAGALRLRERALRADPQPRRRRCLACRVGASRHRVPEAERPASGACVAAEPVAQEASDAGVPARPPRGPEAGDRARRPESLQCAGDVAASVPRRGAGGSAADVCRLPGARIPAASRARPRALAPAGRASPRSLPCACPGWSRS